MTWRSVVAGNEEANRGGRVMTYASTVAELLLGSSPVDMKRAEAGASLSALKNALAKEARSVRWSDARDAAASKVREALDVDCGELLLSSWVRSAMLAKYLDTSRYPPDQTILAHLADHTVKMHLTPSVEILVNEQPVGTIPIDVSLALTIKGGILVIKGGKILEFRSGTCLAMAKALVAGVPVAELKGDPVDLPGVVRFGDGKQLEPMQA